MGAGKCDGAVRAHVCVCVCVCARPSSLPHLERVEDHEDEHDAPRSGEEPGEDGEEQPDLHGGVEDQGLPLVDPEGFKELGTRLSPHQGRGDLGLLVEVRHRVVERQARRGRKGNCERWVRRDGHGYEHVMEVRGHLHRCEPLPEGLEEKVESLFAKSWEAQRRQAVLVVQLHQTSDDDAAQAELVESV